MIWLILNVVVLAYGIYTLINALEEEILKHDRASAQRCRQRQEGVRTS